jgi:hypothetical protein
MGAGVAKLTRIVSRTVAKIATGRTSISPHQCGPLSIRDMASVD